MLGTLLEATGEGRQWPTARDVRGVVAGGLRVRAGLDQRQPATSHLRLTVMLAITLVLIVQSASGIAMVAYFAATLTGQHDSGVPASQAYALLYYLLVLSAVTAAWFGPRVAQTGAALCAIVVILAHANPGQHAVAVALDAALLAGLIVVARRGPRLPKTWLWLAGAESALSALLSYVHVAFFPGSALPAALIVVWWAVIFGLVALWMPIDARPALALALSMTYRNLAADLVAGQWLNAGSWYIPVVGALILAVAATRTIRRQTAL